MKKSRVARTIFAALFLIVFGIFTYKMDGLRLHSRDVESWGPAGGLHPEGYGEAIQVIAESTEPPEAAATPAATETPAAQPELPEVDVNSWELMLVNKDSLLGEDYAPEELVTLTDSQIPVDSKIAEALTAFIDDAKAQDVPVYLSSGYRAYSEQSYLYQRKISQGYSAEVAATIVAVPGTSEHQSGLCADITDYYRELKDSSLQDTETYIWMSAHCQDYGFIVRYPSDKEDITGVIYEPWHFRYVGVEAAKYIMENKLCLEEFLELYK